MNVFKGLFLTTAMVAISFCAQANEAPAKNLQDLPSDIICMIYGECAMIADKEDLIPPQLALVHPKINQALLSKSSRYKEDRKLLQKLGTQLYSKKLIYSQHNLQPGTPQTSLSFKHAVNNGGEFDMGQFPNPDLKEYVQVLLSPKAFFESEFEYSIFLVTTVGAIKAEEKRIKNTKNASIYQLKDLLDAWEEKWKKDGRSRLPTYTDNDMVIFSRHGHYPLGQYKYFAGMFPSRPLAGVAPR